MIRCCFIEVNSKLVIYGIVSTGIFWEFGKLEGQVFTKHALSYSISEPKKVYGLLEHIFTECEKEAVNARGKEGQRRTVYGAQIWMDLIGIPLRFFAPLRQKM